MQGTTLIPHDNIATAPPVHVAKCGRGAVRDQRCQQFAAFIRNEVAKSAQLIKRVGIKAE